MAKATNRALQPTLEPSNPLGQRFLSYFHHGWGFIYAPTPLQGERPYWQTETRYPLQPRNLWQQYLDKSVLLGLRFGQQTNYFMVDLDCSSSLHPKNSLVKYQQLLGCLEEIGLCRPVPVQSSTSGGLHIYYFFEEKQPSYILACAVKQTIVAAGFKIKGGEIEIFPNCKIYSPSRPSSYNAHRLPLQAGSYLLDDMNEPWSDDICDLLDAADWSAAGQDYEALATALATANSQKIIKFPYRQRSATQQWQHHLEERISQGWTGHGQTNELLKDIACYGIVFRHLSGETLVDYIVITASQSPGYVNWCQHQHEIEQRAREWARCCEGYYSPYPGSPQRVNSYKEQFGAVRENKVIDLHPNEQKQQQTLERIRSIVAQLQQTGTFPERTSERARAIIAASKAQYGFGVSQTTLHKPKYLPLWHPEHQEIKPEKQCVNDQPESNTAILNTEKYPQLPDPWIEAEPPETQTAQGKEPQAEKIYTPPTYMKVVYLNSARALPPASLEVEFNQIQKSPISLNSSNSSNFVNSLDLLDSSDSSKILNVTTDKQNQCLVSASASSNVNKQDLLNSQNLSKSNILDVVNRIDSTVDSDCAIAQPDECVLATELSIPVSLPTSTQLDARCSDSPPMLLTELDEVPLAETFTPEDYRQSIRLRLQAIQSARHWVKVYCTTEKLSLSAQERIKLEQLQERLLMLKSPSLILRQEAQEWLVANPDALDMVERLKARNHNH